MRLALTLGNRGMGRTWPNPSVGCVIVRDGEIVGRGWTQPGGRPHAEQAALEAAGPMQTRGATAYVTLEPCAHQGKTPPCAKLLAEAGVARVVFAVSDPYRARKAGSGQMLLKKHGVTVDQGCLAAEARRANLGFFRRILDRRPKVTLKLAMSFDGRIAARDGASKWITRANARRLVHLMRAKHDAVMVGSGTAASDDPMLTPRGLRVDFSPIRLVLDSNLSIPPTCKLGASAKHAPVWICHARNAPAGSLEAWSDAGAVLIECKTAKSKRLDLKDVMSSLAQKGLTRVFCEGGAKLAASLIEDGLVDELVGFTSGRILGTKGIPAVDLPVFDELTAPFRFSLEQAERIGEDAIHRWVRIEGS